MCCMKTCKQAVTCASKTFLHLDQNILQEMIQAMFWSSASQAQAQGSTIAGLKTELVKLKEKLLIEG